MIDILMGVFSGIGVIALFVNLADIKNEIMELRKELKEKLK